MIYLVSIVKQDFGFPEYSKHILYKICVDLIYSCVFKQTPAENLRYGIIQSTKNILQKEYYKWKSGFVDHNLGFSLVK